MRRGARCEFNFPIAVDHVALRVPVLVSVVPIDLNKLLQDSSLTSGTLDRKKRAVMKMTVYLALVLIVTVFRAEGRRAHRTRKMVHMIFGS